MMMIIAIGVTAGTASIAPEKAGLYVVYIGKTNHAGQGEFSRQ